MENRGLNNINASKDIELEDLKFLIRIVDPPTKLLEKNLKYCELNVILNYVFVGEI